uniref:Cytoplasmic dynein 2 light intermediate chain 1 n=1 Tax=Ditylenchus dipsaci TaxID=166011 RepID=A0A915CQH5_9BILA
MNIFELAKRSYEEDQKNRQKLVLSNIDEDTSEATTPETNSNTTREATVIVCGSENCGKSTLIARFLDSRSISNNEGTSNGTIGMEYAYATKTRSNIKDLAHIWELGGGGSLANLLEVVLTEDNIGSTSILLFLDLTKPETFQSVVEPILDVLRRRVDQILAQISTQQSALHDSLVKNCKTKWQTHQDNHVVKPLAIPIAILAAKYDQFQNFDTEKKRTIYKLVRFIAHVNGALLQSQSSSVEGLMTHSRSLLSHHAFGSALNKGTAAVDVHNPVFVPVAGDSLQNIELVTGVSSYNDAMTQCYFQLNENFAQQKTENTDEDSVMDKQFAEPLVDSVVEQKTRALELHIKERRDRQNAQERAKHRLLA